MARRSQEYTVKVTHQPVHNPEAVKRGLQLWASYLAQHLGRRLAQEPGERRKGSA